ncbi:MAG TPA: sigma factor-like helix-turn-helix DNA-binding protein [Terriglobales bacterium]|jgi:RNA polymerase sigma factor (sigma-70 family)|nr:sigma factor-like helix-turn-helix DNA-binding protein [Terriglobales bacterium]
MNVHVSYKVHKTPDIEKEISHQIEKIQKRLHVFRPELVHLKAVIEQNSAREGMLVSLNLRLPSGQLAAQAKAPSPTAATKAAFDELIQQIGRHKELLRSSHKWRRWRGGSQESREPGVPFEQTLAAVLLPTISADDIGSYVNANLSRLERFVDRELYFRRADEEMPSSEDGLSTPEVVNEVIARALGDHDRPEKLSLEPWLYQLALQAMNEMTARLHELEAPIHLEDSRRRQNVQASDEAALQFHQADEGWTRESSIPDRRVSTPEQAAYSDEVIALVQAALRGADRTDREAFLLYGIEGFSLGEIAAITGRHTEAVRESVQRARDCVRSAPSIASEFHHELLVKHRS